MNDIVSWMSEIKKEKIVNKKDLQIVSVDGIVVLSINDKWFMMGEKRFFQLYEFEDIKYLQKEDVLTIELKLEKYKCDIDYRIDLTGSDTKELISLFQKLNEAELRIHPIAVGYEYSWSKFSGDNEFNLHIKGVGLKKEVTFDFDVSEADEQGEGTIAMVELSTGGWPAQFEIVK